MRIYLTQRTVKGRAEPPVQHKDKQAAQQAFMQHWDQGLRWGVSGLELPRPKAGRLHFFLRSKDGGAEVRLLTRDFDFWQGA